MSQHTREKEALSVTGLVSFPVTITGSVSAKYLPEFPATSAKLQSALAVEFLLMREWEL